MHSSTVICCFHILNSRFSHPPYSLNLQDNSVAYQSTRGVSCVFLMFLNSYAYFVGKLLMCCWNYKTVSLKSAGSIWQMEVFCLKEKSFFSHKYFTPASWCCKNFNSKSMNGFFYPTLQLAMLYIECNVKNWTLSSTSDCLPFLLAILLLNIYKQKSYNVFLCHQCIFVLPVSNFLASTLFLFFSSYKIAFLYLIAS